MEMNSGIVRDERGDGCPTDPDVAGIGVSKSRDSYLAALTTPGNRILCIGRTPDYRCINRRCDPGRDLNGRHNISAEEAKPPVQQEPKSRENP